MSGSPWNAGWPAFRLSHPHDEACFRGLQGFSHKAPGRARACRCDTASASGTSAWEPSRSRRLTRPSRISRPPTIAITGTAIGRLNINGGKGVRVDAALPGLLRSLPGVRTVKVAMGKPWAG